MFIETRLLTFAAPEERNVYRTLVALLRSLDWFVTAVAINILLLPS